MQWLSFLLWPVPGASMPGTTVGGVRFQLVVQFGCDPCSSENMFALSCTSVPLITSTNKGRSGGCISLFFLDGFCRKKIVCHSRKKGDGWIKSDPIVVVCFLLLVGSHSRR